MTTKDDPPSLTKGALAVFGVIAQASATRGPTRQLFRDDLREALLANGLRLVSAEVGRLHRRSLWVVTCEAPDGRLVRAQVPVLGSPYDSASQVASDVVQALAAA